MSDRVHLWLDKLEIQELMATYCRAVDRCDSALLASVFEPDAEVISGAIDGPATSFIEGIGELIRAALPRCVHSISNQLIKVCGDRAVAETYVTATNTAGGMDNLVTGRYLNAFRKGPDGWRIVRHHWVLDFSTSIPSVFDPTATPQATHFFGRQDRTDPVYALWDSLEG